MKIADLMTAEVQSCAVDDTLNAAANVMWEHDCGIVPVVDADGRLVGVVTDRDVCMAAFFHGSTLADLPVSQVMARDLHTLPPEASIHDALELMREMQVRPLCPWSTPRARRSACSRWPTSRAPGAATRWSRDASCATTT